MELHKHNRPATSCIILQNIKNAENKPLMTKNTKIPKPPKNRELRNLEAELGVEKYKTILLQEEISQNKMLLTYSNNYVKKLNSLQADYSLLKSSVQRSKNLQEKQKLEIDELKKTLHKLKIFRIA